MGNVGRHDQPPARSENRGLCRIARPGAGGRQDAGIQADGQGDVLPHGSRVGEYRDRPRHGAAQDDPPDDHLDGRAGLPQLHGQRVRAPRVDRLPARRQRLELRPRPAAMVAGEERVPALLVAGGFRQGDDKAGEALQGTRGQLCLEPRDGRVQQDDGFLARQPAVRVQLAPHGLDPRLRTARAGAGQVCARALDRRAAFRRAAAAGDGRRAFLVPGTRRRQHRTTPYTTPRARRRFTCGKNSGGCVLRPDENQPETTNSTACPIRDRPCCFILGQGRPSPAGKGRHPVSQPRLPAKRRAFGPRRSRPEAVCRPQMAGLGRATALVGRERRPPDGEKGSRTDKRYTSTATCRRDRTRPAGGAPGR